LHTVDLVGPKFAIGDFPTLTWSAIFNPQGDEMNIRSLMGKLHLAALVFGAVILSGCGGGGGGSDSTAPPSATNKWASNSGTYVGCDEHHNKLTRTFTAFGTNQATLSIRMDTYDGDLCSGSVMGTFTYSTPVTLTYLSTQTASVTDAGGNTSNVPIDYIQMDVLAMTGTLTGLGVQGLCVYYTGGHLCYNSISTPAMSVSTAIYLTATSLATLTASGDGFIADPFRLTKQ
jgi:hypothetical protein